MSFAIIERTTREKNEKGKKVMKRNVNTDACNGGCVFFIIMNVHVYVKNVKVSFSFDTSPFLHSFCIYCTYLFTHHIPVYVFTTPIYIEEKQGNSKGKIILDSKTINGNDCKYRFGKCD